jgi:multidrug resistance efflux pump
LNIAIKRLDPNVPDPVESRRRAAGRLVRIAYATVVFGILGFFVVYFGAPLVFLSGPGTVSSKRIVVSFPYTVRVTHMNVGPGDRVKNGQEIGQVSSPEQDNIVATYLRALAEVAGRKSELRVKARVAQDSLEAARNYQRLTEEAAALIEKSSSVSMTYRVEIFRERAAAQKAVVGQEAEVAESITQLAELDEMSNRLRQSLQTVEDNFTDGRIFVPVSGIVSTNLAYAGQSLVAGTPVAEILDPTDIFVDWYIPNERLLNPRVGQQVFILFGTRRIYGRIAELLPVSDVYSGTRQVALSERPATQIARIRFDEDAQAPPLNSSVYVRMYYSDIFGRIAARLVSFLGLRGAP